MLRELAARPEVGLLGAKSYWAGRDFIVVQYWRSAEHLGRFARDPEMLHQPAWAAFNRAGAANGTSASGTRPTCVPAANIESLYGNMPEHGLGAALGSEPRGQHGRTSAQDEMGQRTRSTSRPSRRDRQAAGGGLDRARTLSPWTWSSSS